MLPLHPTPFRGDVDVADLHTFFTPEHQFDGHTRWSHGTSLKAGYVNTFEFLNHAPIVQLWRDTASHVQAISQIALGPGTWSFLAAPEARDTETAEHVIGQADAALGLLSAHASWTTVAYESDEGHISSLTAHGYVEDGRDEVYMRRSLADPIDVATDPAGCTIRELDTTDPVEISERGAAQSHAFRTTEPFDELAAWMSRTIRHQLAYGRPNAHPCLIAIDTSGRVLAFADLFFDYANKIAEFEPVGTRKDVQRCGLAKATMLRGLELAKSAGMTEVVVRTGIDNEAAIAAYTSVGFAIEDRRLRFRKPRPETPMS